MASIATGIDIGTHSIKFVELQSSGGALKMNHAGIEFYETPTEELFAEGKIINPEAIGNVIKEHVKNHKLKVKNLVIGISGQLAIIRFIQVPPIENEADLKGLIENSAEQHVPYALEEVRISYHKIGLIQQEESQMYYILLVCAKKEDIDSIMEVLKAAKLKPDVMDIDNLAASNSLEHDLLEEGVVAMVDIGANSTNITIFKDKQIGFCRNIPIGGSSVTSVIKETLNLEAFEQAEEEKISRGINLEGEGDEEVDEVIRTNIEDITSEIRRSFDYYKAQSREMEIHKIILSGGTSKMKNIDQFICNDLGIEVIVGNPIENLEIAVDNPDVVEENQEAFATAIGYALREVVSD